MAVLGKKAIDVRWGERQVLKLWIELARMCAFNLRATVRQGELWLMARAAGRPLVRRVRLTPDHEVNVMLAGRESHSMISEARDRLNEMGGAVPAVL